MPGILANRIASATETTATRTAIFPLRLALVSRDAKRNTSRFSRSRASKRRFKLLLILNMNADLASIQTWQSIYYGRIVCIGIRVKKRKSDGVLHSVAFVD